MDITSLMQTLLGKESLDNLGKTADASEKDVKNVLSSALPTILSGVQNQANDASTAEGFVNALASHAKDSTDDISSFFSNIDIEDGGKILNHLLGSEKQTITQAAADNAGVDVKKSSNILSAAAPLLMSLLGQQTQSSSNNNAAGIGSLVGSLLGGIDLSSILGGLLGGGSSSEAQESVQTLTSADKPKEEKKKTGILSAILNFFRG